MAGLADENLEPTPVRDWLLRVGGALVAIALIGAAAWWLHGTLRADTTPQRQVARITILPDAPPPPPPPPPNEEPKPQQQEAPKPAPEAPRPEAPQPSEQIKMEGPAGDGPSAFAAGNVTREYQGGPTVGGAPAAGERSGGDRVQERLFAQALRQQLQGEIERHLKADAVELVASFSLWVARDGAIERFEIQPSGNPLHDTALRAALDETRRSLTLAPPPAGLPQPLRFRLTVRPLG